MFILQFVMFVKQFSCPAINELEPEMSDSSESGRAMEGQQIAAEN
jgi:hypothetical protein